MNGSCINSPVAVFLCLILVDIQAASSTAAATATAEEETTPSAAEALPLGLDEHQHQQPRQRHQQASRRELRWALPAEGNSSLSSADGPPGQHDPATSGRAAGSGGFSTAVQRRSSLRRATSSSPTPSLSSQQDRQRQPRDGPRRRHTRAGGIDSIHSPEILAGGRRHSASVGPAVRFRRRRHGGAKTGERGLGPPPGREREGERGRRRRSRRPGQLRASVVAGQAAQHAAEDLLSVRAARGWGYGCLTFFGCVCSVVCRPV